MKVLVIGSSNVDISVYVKALPQKGETLLGHSMSTSFGGKGANQAMACGKLGADITFLSCVGQDDYGDQLLKELSKYHVDVSNVKRSESQPTGTAIISIDDEGQNTIVVIAGANNDCDVEYLKNHEKDFIEADYVLLQMEIPMDAIEYAIKKAKSLNKTVILNPAPANSSINPDILGLVDYLTPNETELKIMAHHQDNQFLLDLGVQNLLVTLGESGAQLINREKNELVETFKVKAVDTVGAGDCFNGAFVTALAQGKSDVEAIRFANKAASIAVTRYGAQTGIPTLEEIE